MDYRIRGSYQDLRLITNVTADTAEQAETAGRSRIASTIKQLKYPDVTEEGIEIVTTLVDEETTEEETTEEEPVE